MGTEQDSRHSLTLTAIRFNAFCLSGKLVKVDQIGDDVVEWSVSKPDGSGASRGKGPIPVRLREQLKLDEVLKGGSVKRWAVLSATGDILDSGTGDVPASVFNKVGVLSLCFKLYLKK